MSALAIFGICILITLLLIIIPIFFIGEGLIMLVILFPAMLAKQITGDRGVDFGGKSFVYSIFLFLIIALEIALVASVFFGLYCLLFGYPIAGIVNGLNRITVSPSKLHWLLNINKLLLFILCCFVLLFSYNSFKFSAHFNEMKLKQILLYRVLPLLSFLIGILYLFATRTFLQEYPSLLQLSPLAMLAGYTYAFYIIYSLIRSITSYIPLLSSGIIKLNTWIMFLIGMIFNGVFLYFFYQINTQI